LSAEWWAGQTAALKVAEKAVSTAVSKAGPWDARKLA
jgi:hypothetical protein